MTKKMLLVMVLTIVIVGGVFAQADSATMSKNTVTVDIGPTIIGVSIAGAGNSIGEEDLSTSGFGIAVQYERQILEKLTVAGRFSYLGGGIGLAMTDKEMKAVAEFKIYSFSIEGHARYYPFKGTFFLDGMLGYANMAASLSGEVIVEEEGVKKKESASVKAPRNYFKLGAKLGWRIDFGKPGGFVFEPSIGYNGAIGLGDTLGKKLSDAVDGDVDSDEYDEVFTLLEKFMLGGPCVSLAFGWKF